MSPGGLSHVSQEELLATGLSEEQARFVLSEVKGIVDAAEPQAVNWERLRRSALQPSQPWALHQLLYSKTFAGWNQSELGPAPVWTPILEEARATNLGRLCEAHGKALLGQAYVDPIESFPLLHQLSVDQPEVYWPLVLKELGVKFKVPPSRVLDTSTVDFAGGPGGVWFPGAQLNAAECCLRRPDSSLGDERPAIVWRDEGKDHLPVQTMSLGELRRRASQVANAVVASGFRTGDALAIDMPMTWQAVVGYLGIILAGCFVVSIADSFVPAEIAMRLRISNAKGIFTQDVIPRGGKSIPLYARVKEANAPKAIVLAASGGAPSVKLREGDISWDDFLASGKQDPDHFVAVTRPASTASNILFSSGTTGDPKAIPWSHLTPIKAGADAWAHQDVRRGDVVAWPTNLGWMMGPWLIYAALLNDAAIALYNGSPLGMGFAKFVQDAGVTMLGLVPSIAKAWRATHGLAGVDWGRLRCFSSTGEASSADVYHWLMSRMPGYRPVIEYCGGTEIGGGFITGTLLQPQAAAAFSTPAMGCQVLILDQEGRPQPLGRPCVGECALLPYMLGSSDTLLNADHHRVYFKDMPRWYNGKSWVTLRRHGDELERLSGGYYRAHGRVDDTMNLGGIKVSSVEIERVCNTADPAVAETAAIGVAPAGGGPEQLLIVAVLKEGAAADVAQLLQVFNRAVTSKINPLFKVGAVAVAPSLPRTASNKVMRRVLRATYGPAAGGAAQAKM